MKEIFNIKDIVYQFINGRIERGIIKRKGKVVNSKGRFLYYDYTVAFQFSKLSGYRENRTIFKTKENMINYILMQFNRRRKKRSE